MSSVISGIKNINWRNGLADPWPFTAAWVLAGIVAVLVPVSKWSKDKASYYKSYGYYIEYENQQREYEENQDGDNNNDGENNYYYKACSWFDWACRKKQYYYASNNDGDNNGNSVQLPNWYIFLGGKTEEMQRWEEENTGRRGGDGSTSAAEKFVYTWTLIMFVVILAYGVYALYKRQPKTSLVLILFLFAQFCLMNLVLVTQGVISTDDRDLEDSVYGWYGQMGVLMAYTDFWFMLFSIIFIIAFGVRAFLERRNNNKTSHENEEEKASQYQNYDAPGIQLTPA